MSSIVVKAYWKKLTGGRADGGEEIRRFSVDQDVSTNYIYLTEKIRLAFPSLRNRELTLFWKDSDGDFITISTDDDLMDALSHNMDKDLFRIYIEDVQPMSSQCPPAGGTRCPPSGGTRCPPAASTRCPPASFAAPHLGVMCDGCDGPIFGARFKCAVCPDYDLCTPCRSTGLHGEHQFTSIQNPPIQNMFAEAMKLYQQATASGCTGGPCGETEWNRWWKMPAQQNPNPQQNPNSQDKGNPTTASAAEGAKEAEWRRSEDCEEQQKKQQQEFLKNIGTFAVAMLNPFGFTSENDVKLNKEETSSSSSQSAKKEMRSDESEEGGCRVSQSGNRTTTSGNAPEETTKSSTSATHSAEMGPSPMTSPEGKLATSSHMDTEDQTDNARPSTSSSNEQAVRACLQTLKEMGFSDEGGWLTSLVNVYQGIVTHVLDAIQANQTQEKL